MWPSRCLSANGGGVLDLSRTAPAETTFGPKVARPAGRTMCLHSHGRTTGQEVNGTMSQCHDIYGPPYVLGAASPKAAPVVPVGAAAAAGRAGLAAPAQGSHLGGAQCHDGFWEAGESGATVGGARPRSTWRERTEVVRVSEGLDWRTRRAMREIMEHDGEGAIIVDLTATGANFSGRKELVGFLARARQRGRRAIVVSRDTSQCTSLLGRGLRPIIPVVSSQPEAVRWLARHPGRGLNG